MTIAKRLMQGIGGAVDKLYVDDVFSAYTYTGNNTTQTIINGIDLAGKGGLVWLKNRTGAVQHGLYDSARGKDFNLATNNTTGSVDNGNDVAFSSTGFSVDTSWNAVNGSGYNYISWTFRNAFNFFQVLQVTKSAGSNLVIDLSPYMTTPGRVVVKRTDLAGSWYVWHRSLPAGQLLIGETQAAAAPLGHITVSGTTLTLVNGVIADGTYHIEAYAHDPSAEGIIQCGTFTTDGSGNATVNLGWEPQYVMLKRSSGTGSWPIADTMRKMAVGTDASSVLFANDSASETASAGHVVPTATGFVTSPASYPAGAAYIYIAIRRPNKPPTLGTQVYNAIARTGTNAVATITGVGFAPDLVSAMNRPSATDSHVFVDRLRGAGQALKTISAAAEFADTNSVTAFTQDGIAVGADSNGNFNLASPYINHFFKRAPGVFDIVCEVGTSSAKDISHSLVAIPELIIRRSRTNAYNWQVYCQYATGNLVLQQTNAQSANKSLWTNGTVNMTASTFSVAAAAEINASGDAFVSYLYATLAGVSKIGSFIKVAGVSLNVDCGFATGARFVLLKRTDAAGGWIVYDVVRGLTAGNDPYLLLNTTAAEVTTTDWIDPYAAGFTIPDGGLANGSYIFHSFA